MLRWAFIILIIALTVPFAFSLYEKSSREVTHHPDAVLISGKGPTPAHSKACCGVLLSPTVVLTVAHALIGCDSWEVTAPYARGAPTRATSKDPLVHPNYKPMTAVEGAEHDLALLILESPIDIAGDFPTLPGDKLYGIETSLLVVGRTSEANRWEKALFETHVKLVAVPGNINLYGGHPQVCKPGDSGGPVYLARTEGQLVGLVNSRAGWSRFNVPIDLIVPLGGRHKDWILSQLSSKGDGPRTVQRVPALGVGR